MFNQNPDCQPRRNRLPRHQDRPQDGHQATVAVYSEADKDALFVDPPTKPSASARRLEESYLVADKIIAACKQTGARRSTPATASCPRTPSSPRRLEEEGIKFIGPKHYSIAKMGDKIESKKLAIEAGSTPSPATTTPSMAPISRRDRQEDRLSGDDQGLRRRWRQGSAFPTTTPKPTKASPPASMKPATPSATTASSSKVRARAAPHRDPGAGRLPRQLRISQRARLLHPAPSPEGHRRGAEPFVDPEMRKAMGEQAVAWPVP